MYKGAIFIQKSMKHYQRKIPVLPIAAYVTEEFFDQEMQLIFGNSWAFAGFVEDLQDAGDYLTVQCGHQNIVVVKGEDGQLRAFHNLCKHRGTQLLRTTGKKRKVLTCPYHDWTYNLEGKLISVPQKASEFPHLDMKSICLNKASVNVWNGIIWVHPRPQATPVAEEFAGCVPYLGPYQPERLIEYPETKYEHIVQANWKIVVENYMDVYHLSHLHSSTLNMYNHAEAKYGFAGDHFWFTEPLAETYQARLDDLIPYKRIAEVSDEQLGAYVSWLFPTVGITASESSWSTFQIVPLAPDQTKVIVRTKLEPMTEWGYYRQKKKSDANWYKLMKGKAKYENMEPDDPMASGDIMAEDIYACEQLQKSLKNSLFEVGALAQNQESTIVKFQEVVAKWLALARNEE